MSKDQSDDDSDFASLMPGVKRLSNDRINVYQHRQPKLASVKRDLSKLESNTDFTSLNFAQQSMLTDSHFDHGIHRKLQRKIRQGLLTIEDSLDLHGHTQNKAVSELSRFIQQALSSGLKMVIIIHGKGTRSSENAVIKPLVFHWLSQQNTILAWCPAQPKHGGSGASYVYLRQQ